MPTSKTCGNCVSFIRIKKWGGDRNGLCDTFDHSVHADGRFAKSCPGFVGKKYERIHSSKVNLLKGIDND